MTATQNSESVEAVWPVRDLSVYKSLIKLFDDSPASLYIYTMYFYALMSVNKCKWCPLSISLPLLAPLSLQFQEVFRNAWGWSSLALPCLAWFNKFEVKKNEIKKQNQSIILWNANVLYGQNTWWVEPIALQMRSLLLWSSLPSSE